MGTQTNGNGVNPQGNVLPGAGGGLDQNGNPVSNTASGSWYLETCPGQPPVSVFVPTGAGGLAPAPPPPPGPGEVAAVTPFPAETIHTSPCGTAVTGLSTWLWATVGAAPVPAVSTTSTIRGYAVVTTASPTGYQWNMGDGHTVSGKFSGTGTAAGASATYTYQTVGHYSVTLTVQWSGHYTFTGYGLAQTVPLSAVGQAPPMNMALTVEQVTTVLVDPTAPVSTLPPPTSRTNC